MLRRSCDHLYGEVVTPYHMDRALGSAHGNLQHTTVWQYTRVHGGR